MKKLLATAWLVTVVLCAYNTVTAQTSSNDYATFFIDITNSSYEPSVQVAGSGDGVEVTFTQTTVNDLASSYTFRQCHKAFPNSTDPALEETYLIEVNSMQFLYDLQSYNNTIFANGIPANFQEYYVEITDPTYVPTYKFDNYISTVTFTQTALNDLAADYSFTGFYPAFPNSTEPAQQSIYIVKVNTPDFMTGLSNYNSTIFTGITPVQRHRFLLTITDPAYVPQLSINTNNRLIVSFTQTGVQNIANKYTITDFHQSYPKSALEHLRQLYFVECSSPLFLTELKNYDNSIFPNSTVSYQTRPAYTPADYGHAFSAPNNHQRYLDLINATDAWTIEKGDPSVKMAISDWYVDINHPDLAGKIRTTGLYINNPSHIYTNPSNGLSGFNHGTAVAGTMVGATDNIVSGDTIGQASIGFNCTVGVYSTDGIGDASKDVLELSQDTNRVINCSWIYDLFCKDDTTNITKNYLYASPELEDVFNEVYENGALVVCGAGNNDPSPNCIRSSFMFPASFPHNISVTSVGSNIRGDTAVNFDTSVMDEHDYFRVPFPSLAQGHNHNKLVDLCAPGYSVHILDFDPSNTSKKYLPNKYGTSYATPMVSGTAGLILSIDDCYSPYQLEYILKGTSDANIYNITANQPYTSPNKLLGSGRLDAHLALQKAQTLGCNDSATRTMYIEEIKINHTCFPPLLGNNPITLTPIIQNGNGNYTYRWRRISNNTVALDNEYAAQPTVLDTPYSFKNSAGQYVLYYMLTVTEAGADIPKVASYRIKVILRESGVDYAMKDAYADMYNEANNMDTVDNRSWNFWKSPDLWVRWHADSLPQHQDPEYSTSDSNYVYVRIKNIGCYPPAQVGDEKLRVYWTKASTGEIWPGNWTRDSISGTNGLVPAGQEITKTPIDLPILYPGDSTIIAIPWMPPNPADYDTGSIQMETCLLARIVDNSLNEVNGNVFTNVRNNNNIVTRNLFVNDFTAGKRVSKHSIDISNAQGTNQTFTLELINDKHVNRHYSGDLSEYMYGVLYLNDLYQVWIDGGSAGSGFILDDDEHTLTFDMATPLILNNINLNTDERHSVYVEFIVRDNINVPFAVRDQFVHLKQSYIDDEDIYQLSGSVSFAINIDKIEDSTAQNKPTTINNFSKNVNEQYLIAYPNPANNYVIFDYKLPGDGQNTKLTISNITGQIIQEIRLGSGNSRGKVKWGTGQNPSGVYIYKLTDKNQILDIGKLVITK